jgi:hypothetical protein
MSLLLVDDRDGRVLAEVEHQDDLQRLLETLWGDEDVPDYLCLVEFHEHQGALLGTDTNLEDPAAALARRCRADGRGSRLLLDPLLQGFVGALRFFLPGLDATLAFLSGC